MNDLVCIHCGKQYISQRSDSKYCSDACRVAFARRVKQDKQRPDTPIDWKDDEDTAHKAIQLINEVPRLRASIQGHYQRHGAIATRELVDALWRVYIYVSPHIKKPRLSQKQYYEMWEHEVELHGGYVGFWLPLWQSGNHRDWLREMYGEYGVDLRDVTLKDDHPLRV